MGLIIQTCRKVLFKIYKLFFIVFVFFINNNSFSQNFNEYEKHGIKGKSFEYENLEPLYIGSFLSSIIASKNKDYKSFLNFSEKALKSNSNNIELLENAFWANIYLGDINRALEIISDIELISDDHNQDFLYPTIIELIRRNELSSAVEISYLLGLEEHNVFIKNMLQIWDHVFKSQRASAISKLKNYTASSKKNSDLYFYLRVQSLIIHAYFDEYSSVIKELEELQKNINNVPSRFYISIANIIYNKIDEEKAQSFLRETLPKNLDLEIAIEGLKKNDLFDPLRLLSDVFYESGYIIARSDGFLKSIPQFWFSLYLNESNQSSRLILSSFFSEVNQDDIALDILKNNKSKSSSWVISEFEKSYILEKTGNIDLAISIIEQFSNYEKFKNKTLIRISNIYRRNNDYKKSMEILDKIDFSKTVAPEVFYYRSLNLVLLKDWKNAIESFDTLLEKYPNNPEISNFVGYTLVDRNIRLDEGIDLIQFAVSKEPQNGFFLDSLGWAFYKLNDFKKAIIYLERAIELEPQEMEITDHLGDAYFIVGRKKEAKLVWERALSLNGNKDLLNKIKKKLKTNFNHNK